MKGDKSVEVSVFELKQADFVQAMREVRLRIVCAQAFRDVVIVWLLRFC
jgi:hypothetical protein